MKKMIKLCFLPLFGMMVSCTPLMNEEKANPIQPSAENEKPYRVSCDERGVFTIDTSKSGDGDFVTYLMMSKYGYLKKDEQQIFGEDVPEKFLENTIKWVTDTPTIENPMALPAADTVYSTVNGAKFRGWVTYNDHTYPDYLTNVPLTSGTRVFAIFDGDGQIDPPTPGGEFLTGNFYVVGNKNYASGSSEAGESWDDANKAYLMSESSSQDPNVAKQYKATVQFAINDEWKLRTKDSYVDSANIESGGAITSGGMSVTLSGNMKVNVAGKYDIYLKEYNSGYHSYYVTLNDEESKPSESSFTVYFETADWWKKDNAASAIYYWGNALGVIFPEYPGTRMNQVNDDIWKFEVPAGVTGFMFTRVNNSGEIAYWGAKTIDLNLTMMGNNNLFSIKNSVENWDTGVAGTWSTYSA